MLATTSTVTTAMNPSAPARPQAMNGNSHSSGPPTLCRDSGLPSGPGTTWGAISAG